MQHLQIFNYNDNKVTFQNENGVVFVNATEMAKPFSKRTNDYLNNQSTIEFIRAWVDANAVAGFPVTVKQGGNDQGTWMHEDVAIDFAQWLSPVFRVWCNQRIKELLTTGKVEIVEPSEDEIILKSQRILTERVERLQEQNKLLIQTVKEQAPKVEYHDQVLIADNAINVTVIAKELGMSAELLNKKLHEMGVIYKSGHTWVLYGKYQSLGYTKTRTHHYVDSLGQTKTNHQTCYTEAGRMFIHNLFKKAA